MGQVGHRAGQVVPRETQADQMGQGLVVVVEHRMARVEEEPELEEELGPELELEPEGQVREEERVQVPD